MSTPPPPKNLLFFICTRGGWEGEWLFAVADIFWDAVVSAWLGYSISQMLFFDAVVSARVGYSISQMLFRMRWYLQEWDIRCCGCFFPATHV